MDRDSWFAGFTDGEGSFHIYRQRKISGNIFVPRFSIQLRADDGEILQQLQEIFGGRIGTKRKSLFTEKGKEYVRKPSSLWEVTRKSDLSKIVRYFDEFPLRSKKSRDFPLWKMAVEIYIGEGCTDKRLGDLQRAIRDGREFDATSFPAPDLGPEQLELGGVFLSPSPH